MMLSIFVVKELDRKSQPWGPYGEAIFSLSTNTVLPVKSVIKYSPKNIFVILF